MDKRNTSQSLDELINNVRQCTLCSDQLEHGVRPILQAQRSSTILIAGQAPGSKVHATGVPFDDASGNRLRDWMGVDFSVFYDSTKIAILPMGFCYPGKGKSGDLPPLPVCAQTWRQPLLDALPNIQLTLVIGQYAQHWHLPNAQKTLTATVKNYSTYDETLIPLPHPSPRNNIWMSKNPWFAKEVLPVVRERVAKALKP